MKQNPDQFKFVFNSRQEDIPAVLERCQHYINENAGEKPVDISLLSRVKWVITELLTNAVKHSGADECLLRMFVRKTQLVIEKEDNGTPLSLNDFNNENQIAWPILAGQTIEDFQIYHNGMDSLRVSIDNYNLATFYTEELPESQMPALLLDTSEHFGLLIITKASDGFIYEYNNESGMSKFRVTFNLTA